MTPESIQKLVRFFDQIEMTHESVFVATEAMITRLSYSKVMSRREDHAFLIEAAVRDILTIGIKS